MTDTGDTFDAEMRRAIEQENQKLRTVPGPSLRSNEPPEHRFMVVTDNLADLLLETARAHLTRAENNYKRVELEVTALRARSKQMWEELEAFNKELDAYSHDSIGIHERFTKKGQAK
jgi:hypothetical protein